MLPMSEVQAAVYAALVPALAPVPVLDYAGPNQTYPYATIGELTAEHNDTLGERGSALEVMVHIWSRQPGMLELQTMMAMAESALHRQTLTLSGGLQWVASMLEYSSTLRDADGVTRHGVMRFRVMVFQAAAVVVPS